MVAWEMSFRAVVLLVVGLTCADAGAALAGKKAKRPETGAPPEPSRYTELRSELERGNLAIDYAQLRLAFAETAGFSPYGVGEADLVREARKGLEQGDATLALERALKVLEGNYVYPEAHLLASRAYRELGNSGRAEFHLAVLHGLFESIRDSGKGSQDSPYVVITTDEEYFVLGMLGLKSRRQALLTCAGKPCDMLEGVDPKTEEVHEYYFDVSIPMGYMSGALGEK